MKEEKFGNILGSMEYLTCPVVLAVLAMKRLTMSLISAGFVQESYPALHFFSLHNEKGKEQAAGRCRKTCEMKHNSVMNGIL